MHTFTDAAGRDWRLNITNGDALRLHRTLDIDLMSADALKEIFANPVTLGRVLWLLVERQATERTVTEDDFADGLDSLTAETAGNALVGALVLFTQPGAAGRVAAGRLPGILAKAARVDATKAMQALDQLEASIASSGSSPASPGSPTPAP